MQNLDTPYAPCGRVVTRKIGEETLLVPVSGVAAGARVYPLNVTALAVWNCLSAGGTVRQAAGVLAEWFEVSLPEAMADSAACAREFLADSLLEERRG